MPAGRSAISCDDLLRGLLRDRPAAVVAGEPAHPRPEHAQVVVDLGDGAHGGARVAAGRLLLDGDGGGQAADGVVDAASPSGPGTAGRRRRGSRCSGAGPRRRACRRRGEDLPEPETPVRTTSFFLGISTVTFLRLCWRAPVMMMRSSSIGFFDASGPPPAPRRTFDSLPERPAGPALPGSGRARAAFLGQRVNGFLPFPARPGSKARAAGALQGRAARIGARPQARFPDPRCPSRSNSDRMDSRPSAGTPGTSSHVGRVLSETFSVTFSNLPSFGLVGLIVYSPALLLHLLGALNPAYAGPFSLWSRRTCWRCCWRSS